jgi:hypothetical protein
MTSTLQPLEPPHFTPEQLVVLTRFADHVSAGRKWTVRLFKFLAWLGAFAGAAAAFLYFAVETARDWPWGTK